MSLPERVSCMPRPMAPVAEPFTEHFWAALDQGRFEVTKNEADRHMFRVPTLRNVAETAPYFHNGSVPDLKTAIRVMGKVQLNKDLNDEQVNSLHAFLESLTGTKPMIEEPKPL